MRIGQQFETEATGHESILLRELLDKALLHKRGEVQAVERGVLLGRVAHRARKPQRDRDQFRVGEIRLYFRSRGTRFDEILVAHKNPYRVNRM